MWRHGVHASAGLCVCVCVSALEACDWCWQVLLSSRTRWHLIPIRVSQSRGLRGAGHHGLNAKEDGPRRPPSSPIRRYDDVTERDQSWHVLTSAAHRSAAGVKGTRRWRVMKSTGTGGETWRLFRAKPDNMWSSTLTTSPSPITSSWSPWGTSAPLSHFSSSVSLHQIVISGITAKIYVFKQLWTRCSSNKEV